MMLQERAPTGMTEAELSNTSYCMQKNRSVRAKSATSPNIQIYQARSNKENL